MVSNEQMVIYMSSRQLPVFNESFLYNNASIDNILIWEIVMESVLFMYGKRFLRDCLVNHLQMGGCYESVHSVICLY